MMRERWTRLVDWFRRDRLERDLGEELQFHRQQLERAAADEGAAPDAARRSARRQLGDPLRITEAVRERWSIRWIDHARRDLRHAVRALRRTPGFTVIAIGTLGVGLALSVTVMTVLNAYILRGLPYPAGDRLYNLQLTPTRPGAAFPAGLDTLDWASLGDLVELPIAWDLDQFTIRGPHPEAAQGAWITPDFVEGFGVRPFMGPGIHPDDFQPGRPPVALISHGLWQRRFGGDPGVIGQRFDAFVSDRPDAAETFTIVGVLPNAFWHTNAFTDVLAPLRGPWYPYVVRVRAGVRPDALQARVSTLLQGVADPAMAGWRMEVRATHANYVAGVAPLLLSVATATALVLLIACANVAVLMLVRATERRREMAVRKAIGASGAQVIRSLLAETLVLAVGATTLGMLLASFALTTLAPIMGRQLGRSIPGGPGALEMSWIVLAVTGLGGLVLTLACSVAPVWAATRAPVSLALHAGQRTAGGGPGQRRARAVLIAGEVAACLTLLVGAALTVRSGLRILDVDLGLNAQDVLVGNVSLRQRSHPDAASRGRFFEALETQAAGAALPIALGNFWPMQAPMSRDVEPAGPSPSAPARAGVLGVSPGYFDTLGVALRDGRAFETRDGLSAPRVAIVSETLARRLWPDRRAVGEELRFVALGGAAAPPPSGGAAAPPPPVIYRVVGVASDTRHTHTDDDLADVYVALLQQPSLSAFVYARAAGPPDIAARRLRAVLAGVDPDVAVSLSRPLADIVDQQRAGPRFLAALLVVFAAFAALLALVGLYGVIAYAVRQRQREIALRLAIGADRSAITRLFVRQGGRVLLAGLAIGVGGAVVLGRVLQTQLFGVNASDPVSLWATTAAFAACGLLAVAWPARAAASTDPAAALKE